MSKHGPVGIDFGTTKTALAFFDEKKEKQIISLPTTVWFAEESKYIWETAIVGEKEVRGNPIRVWKNFKPFLGNEYLGWRQVPPNCHPARLEKDASPPPVVLLTAFTLRELKKRYCTEQRLTEPGSEEWDIGPATITVPAFSTFRQRQALIFAARLAGFGNISLLEEPVAAYLMYRQQPPTKIGEENPITLVIDFGGGTLDLALMSGRERGAPDILGTYTVRRGNKNIGGNDVDLAIIDYWKQEHPSFLSSLPQVGAIDPRLSYGMVAAAQDAKEKHNPKPNACNPPITNEDLVRNPILSEVDTSKLINGSISVEGNVSISLDEKIVRYPPLKPGELVSILDKIEFPENLNHAIEHLLTEQHLTRPQISQTILSGGSSYIRRVIEQVREGFPHLASTKDGILIDEPEFAICYGALNHQVDNRVFNNRLRNILSLSMYLEVDFDPRKDTDWFYRDLLSNTKFIHHEDRHYIQLAKRGTPLDQVRGVLAIPFPAKHKKGHSLKIYQVSPRKDGCDYLNIPDHDPEEQIIVPPGAPLITFLYGMDRSGIFFRSVTRTLRIAKPKSWQGLYQELNWKKKEVIKEYRERYFQEKAS